jgi:hypothetical protein
MIINNEQPPEPEHEEAELVDMDERRRNQAAGNVTRIMPQPATILYFRTPEADEPDEPQPA